MKINDLKRKYNGKAVEDLYCYMSEEAKSFARHLKATIKTIAQEQNFELVSYGVGHYYIYGFLKKEDKFIYFSRDIERYEQPIDLEKSGVFGFLVRTAKHEKDYTGGCNNYCGLSDFGNLINRI